MKKTLEEDKKTPKSNKNAPSTFTTKTLSTAPENKLNKRTIEVAAATTELNFESTTEITKHKRTNKIQTTSTTTTTTTIETPATTTIIETPSTTTIITTTIIIIVIIKTINFFLNK